MPKVAGSGHTSPLGPDGAVHGVMRVRLVTMGHLLGRSATSLKTRPALDGLSASARPPWQTPGWAVKGLSEILPAYSTRT